MNAALIGLGALAFAAFALGRKKSPGVARLFLDHCSADTAMSDAQIVEQNQLIAMVSEMKRLGAYEPSLAASLRAQAAGYASAGMPLRAKCTEGWAALLEAPGAAVPLAAPGSGVVFTSANLAGRAGRTRAAQPAAPVVDPRAASDTTIRQLANRWRA